MWFRAVDFPQAAAVNRLIAASAQMLKEEMQLRADALTPAELNLLMLWEDMMPLTYSLMQHMVAGEALDRIYDSSKTFNVLAEQGVYVPDPARWKDRFTPLVARCIAAAVPGSKIFIWIPPRLKAPFKCQQLEAELRKFPPLLTKALGDVAVTSVKAIDVAGAPTDDADAAARMTLTGANTFLGRSIRLSNSSEIFIFSTDFPAPVVLRATKGMDSKAVCAVIAHDPDRQGRHMLPEAIMDLAVQTFALEKAVQQWLKEFDGMKMDGLPGKEQPCALMLMF